MIVGRFVSITIFSGHFCADRMRIPLLSMLDDSCREEPEVTGKYHPTQKSIASSMLPAKAKYRPIGTVSYPSLSGLRRCIAGQQVRR